MNKTRVNWFRLIKTTTYFQLYCIRDAPEYVTYTHTHINLSGVYNGLGKTLRFQHSRFPKQLTLSQYQPRIET